MIWGGTISGNWANGRPLMAMKPTTTVIMAMTIATIGRLMKKVEIMDKTLSYCGDLGEGATNGFGLTTASGLTFCVPSTTTLSPAFNPSSIIHIDPTRLPTLTGRTLTLLSPTTTATW